MYCPVGYVSWSEMCEMTEDWALRIMLARKYDQEGIDPSLAFDSETQAERQFVTDEVKRRSSEAEHDIDLYWERQVHINILSAWILTKVIQEFETLVCSPHGSLMRAPPQLRSHLDELQWCYPWVIEGEKTGWSLRNTSEFSRYFEIFDQKKKSFPNIADRLCFIDATSGTVTVKNNSLNYLINWGGEDRIGAQNLIDKVIRPYVGWSMVWDPDEFPETLWEVLQMLGVDQPNWRSSTETQGHSGKKGRKGLVKARSEFSMLTPEELDLPHKEIAILLRDRTGEHPAESTIRLWKGLGSQD